jgi:hypothetical protein
MNLQKPFDTAALIAQLKADGIPEAEKLAEQVIRTTFDWLESSCTMAAATQPLFAIATPLLMAIEPALDGALRKAAGV